MTIIQKTVQRNWGAVHGELPASGLEPDFFDQADGFVAFGRHALGVGFRKISGARGRSRPQVIVNTGRTTPWLGGRDSNPDKQIQSLPSYR